MALTTLDIDSPSQLAGSLQVPVSTIMRVVDELNIRPVFRIDGRPMFDADAADLIRDHLIRQNKTKDVIA